jgi:outer membrane receptor for monomeric catechols
VTPGGGINPPNFFAKSQPWLDLSASYKVNEKLTLTFDATNLLDSHFQDCFGRGAQCGVFPRDTRRFDKTYEVGLRFKL